MGIFSKKKVVTVGVTAVNMVDKIEEPYKQRILTSVLGKKNIVDLIKQETLNGFGSKVNRYYRYGRNKYERGLPEGYKNYSNINLTAISNVLKKIFVLDCNVSFAKVSFADKEYFAYRKLQDDYLFNPATMLLLKPPVIYPTGTTVTVLSVNLTTDFVAGVYVEIQKPAAVLNGPLPPKENTQYNINYEYDENSVYLQVKYQLPENVSSVSNRYWWYPVNSNTYPELEKIIKEGYTSPFYPLVPIRQNKVNVINTNTQLKTDVTKMLKILDINLSVVTDAIMSTAEGNTPENIDECFIGFFANLSTERKETIAYLWEFFNKQYDKKKVTKAEYDAWYINKGNRDTPQEAMIIQEADFNIRLLWNYIYKEEKTGIIGPIGSAVKEITTSPRLVVGDFDFERSKLVITKQIAENIVSEITVHGLEHLTDVYEGSLHRVTLADLSNDDMKGGFFIPLEKKVLDNLKPDYREVVLMDGLTLVVYGVQISYVKWYQRGLFRSLIKIVALVLAVYSLGWSNLLSQGVSWATAATILSNVITTIIIMEGLQLLAKVLGAEVAAIIAAVTAVYAVASGDFTSMESLFASDLLQASNLMFAASNKVTLKEYNKLMTDTADLIKSVKEKQEEIKEAYDLLGKHGIDFFDITRGGAYFNPNESSAEFFDRTINNRNPGVAVYDYIYYYYENKLNFSLDTKGGF